MMITNVNYISRKSCFNSFQVIAPQFKHFQKLRELVEMRLPPGFPVKIDLPIFPTISARITFHEFKWKNGTGKLFYFSSQSLPFTVSG